jgi:hypothetical protein
MAVFRTWLERSGKPQEVWPDETLVEVGGKAGMKLPIQGVVIPRTIFQFSLLLAIAGMSLSGCRGGSSGIFPSDWNLPDAPAAAAHSAGAAQIGAEAQTNAMPGSSLAAPDAIGGLQRQADCSLTYYGFTYAPGSAAVAVTPNSAIPHYEKILHEAASLGSTPDRFLTGCADTDRGITSRPVLFLGLGQNGRELVAVAGPSGVATSGLKSDGTYTAPATQATPLPSISLLSADLNQDGNADLVSVNSNGLRSSITVFLGNGDGTFQPGADYALPGANAQYAVVDDLNGDGILDLLVSSESPAFSFSIFLGNGDGTFQPPRTFAPANGLLHFSEAFLTADVNGDGARDIVTAQGHVLLGKGDGVTYTLLPQAAFAPITTPTNNFAPSVVAADFNHDGRMDLATDDGATVRVYLGNGDGTFTAGPEYPAVANYGFLSATDLDGDGNIDLWSGYAGNGMYGGDGFLPNEALALMGNGDGTFRTVPGLPATASPFAASKLAPKRDQATPLVLSAPSPGKITVVAGTTSSPITVTASTPTGTPQGVTFSCSGLPAMASCNFSPSPLNLTATQASGAETITIATTLGGQASPARREPPPGAWTYTLRLAALALLALSAGLFRARRRRLGWAASALLLLLAFASLSGCVKNSTPSNAGGTPPGIYTLTITGQGAATVTAPGMVTVTINAP